MAKINQVKKFWRIEPIENANIRAMLSYPPDYYQRRLKKIGFTGKNTKLLDAACGAGHWSIAASFLNAQVEGLDANNTYLNVARRINQQFKRKNIKFNFGRLESLPYPDDHFDHVICYCAWMYTKKAVSLKEMTRVLKPGGKIYLGAVAGLGWYLKMIGEALVFGNRHLLATAFGAIGAKIQTAEKQTRKLLAENHLKIIALGPDASLGEKIVIKPIYKPKVLGFWNVYEVIAQKERKNEQHEN